MKLKLNFVIVAYLIIGCASDFIYLDETCKLDCTLKNSLPCKVELHEQCPQHMKVNPYLWPGQPDHVVSSTEYTYSQQTKSCDVHYRLSWIPPNDDSGKRVKGFVLKIAPMGGPYIGRQECVVFNMENATWTDKDIIMKLGYSFSCFKHLNRGSFAIDLYTLPPPSPEGLNKRFNQTIHFKPAFYDKGQKKCLTERPVSSTTTPYVNTIHTTDDQKDENPDYMSHAPVTRGNIPYVQGPRSESEGNPDTSSFIKDPLMKVIYIIAAIAALSLVSIFILVLKKRKKQFGYQRLLTDDDNDIQYLNNRTSEESTVVESSVMRGDSVSRLRLKPDNKEVDSEPTMVTVDQGVYV